MDNFLNNLNVLVHPMSTLRDRCRQQCFDCSTYWKRQHRFRK